MECFNGICTGVSPSFFRNSKPLIRFDYSHPLHSLWLSSGKSEQESLMPSNTPPTQYPAASTSDPTMVYGLDLLVLHSHDCEA